MTDEEKLEDYPLVREELRKREGQLRALLRLVNVAENMGKDSIPIKMIKEDIFDF